MTKTKAKLVQKNTPLKYFMREITPFDKLGQEKE